MSCSRRQTSSNFRNYNPSECVIDIPLSGNTTRYIYKVPKNLRELHEKVYTPQLISIGPVHHDSEDLGSMEKHKENYFRKFCERPGMELKDLKDLLDIYKQTKMKAYCVRIFNRKDIEELILNSYAENCKFDHSGDNNYSYMKMIMLDAVFIIELFLRDYSMKKKKEEEKEDDKVLSCFRCFSAKKEKAKKEKEEEKVNEINPEEEEKKVIELNPDDDYLLKNQWLKNSIQQDLLLLENQLPYFFLKELYKLAFPAANHITFDDLTRQYFKEYNPQDLPVPVPQDPPVPHIEILHFTDLLRYFMSHNHPEASKNTSRTKIQVNAAKLHKAGVEFEVNKKACLTDIKFNKGMLRLRGKLKMPQFHVDNTTERVLRNLVAYEQWHYSSEAYISYYIFLMDCLINTAEDVELLIEKKIIVNWLGSNEEVAKLFNNLYINITKYNSCYHHICDDLNDYYNSRPSRVIATLFGVYFSDFWRGTATVAAVVLLALTFLQTMNSFWALH